MRVLLGLAALAAGVSAQATTTLTVLQTSGSQYGSLALAKVADSTPLSSVRSYFGSVVSTAQIIPTSSYTVSGTNVAPNLFTLATPTTSPTGNYIVNVPNSVTSVIVEAYTNPYVAQVLFKWSPNFSLVQGSIFPGTTTPLLGSEYLCDPCTLAAGTFVGSYTACSNAGPLGVTPLGTNPNNDQGQAASSRGYRCGNLNRFYRLDNLVTRLSGLGVNSIGFLLYDLGTNAAGAPTSASNSYNFIFFRAELTRVVGDPQIVGMQGQDFQVHGIPDEVFNMVSYPSLQINARFSYLESADCLDNYTACFAHPGTYISEEGFRIGKDKVRVTAGSHKKGLTVSVNGKKVNRNTDLKLGAVEIVNHRRVVFHTNIMKVTVTNSDKFLNQELELNDDKLISLGAKRRHLKDGEKFHAEVPLHGLQGQTWRNVEYASGLDYEGSITDYHVVDGNLFGTDFVFNQFEA